ncbi:3-hydroxylacyl-ACP dehydratase [Azoarcus sp. TTM-91]|uniref:3-hydroxylacyl-ACP dehydratase n=1 Tax=Azoarcus sp. TTM-91 TaxID=2691581 RepID=UPI00145E0E47|nr:3-hydroxylacyl-ACP dehydratase [Azoarcus sp. TTM-91]NMG35886.1 3-hydroxylacyl-ACP dehydratase [Azoarcus sp. TTM-91]
MTPPDSQAGTAALDHAWIAAHVPHQGSMCLLDAVESWSPERIRCRAVSHCDPANPLRAGGRLGALTGIEYAAQAMAVHGALRAGGEACASSRPGMLGSARAVECLVSRLDDIADDLQVEAECLSADDRALLYAFTLSAGGRPLLRGRASVVLSAA